MPSALKVVSICAYLTGQFGNWRNEDYDAMNMVKALKGEPLKGSFQVDVGGAKKVFHKENVAEFVELIPGVLASAILERIKGTATLVPIPNSHVISADTPDFKTLDLARKVAAASDGRLIADPALVFRSPQTPSRKGGSRDPFHLEAEYRMLKRPPGQIVLLDDVTTTGAHLIAACWRLNSAATRVVLGCAFGSTIKEQLDEPISIREQEISISKYNQSF